MAPKLTRESVSGRGGWRRVTAGARPVVVAAGRQQPYCQRAKPTKLSAPLGTVMPVAPNTKARTGPHHGQPRNLQDRASLVSLPHQAQHSGRGDQAQGEAHVGEQAGEGPPSTMPPGRSGLHEERHPRRPARPHRQHARRKPSAAMRAVTWGPAIASDETQIASTKATKPETNLANRGPPRTRAAMRPTSTFPASRDAGAPSTNTAFSPRYSTVTRRVPSTRARAVLLRLRHLAAHVHSRVPALVL